MTPKEHKYTWKDLRIELQQTFGRNEVKFFNDKNKYTRRIKIWGKNKYKVRDYLQLKYPNLTIWESDKSGCYGGYFSGICFNLKH